MAARKPKQSTGSNNNGLTGNNNGIVHHNSPFGGFADPIAINRLQETVANWFSAESSTFRRDPLSQTLDPRRSIADECGYPNTFGIPPTLYRELYMRDPIGRRVVQLMPKECWQTQPSISEDDDPEKSTDFEEAWDELGQSLRAEKCWYQDEEGSPIWEHLRRIDILSGIGHFGVLLIGVDDGKNLDQPIDGVVSLTPQSTDYKANPRSEYDTPGRNAFTYPSTPVVNSAIRDEGWEGGKKKDQIISEENEYIVRNKNPNDDRIQRGSGYASDQFYEQTTPNQNDPGNWGYASTVAPLGTDAQYVGVELSPPQYPINKPSSKQRRILFLRAFDEALVQIVQYEADIRNPRFSLPIMYRITLNDPRDQHSGVGLPLATVRVHWSRVVHIADNLTSSEIFGDPRMRSVLNRLLDLQKMYGGSGEGYWRMASPGLSLETHPQMGGDALINKPQLLNDLEQYFNGLQTQLILRGMAAKTISGTVQDPAGFIESQITAICIDQGCPKRVFMGAERGELASSQDDDNWNDRKRERQLNYITPRIIVPFIDRLILIGVLPEPEGYSVTWPSLDAISAKDKAMIAFQKTQAAALYVSGNLETFITPLDYMTDFLEIEDDRAKAMLKASQEAHEQEETSTIPPQGDAGHPAATTDEKQEAQQQRFEQQQQYKEDNEEDKEEDKEDEKEDNKDDDDEESNKGDDGEGEGDNKEEDEE